MCDTEVESVMQPQNMANRALSERPGQRQAAQLENEEGVYQSLYMNGFTAFDQLQRDMVVDILSDDEDSGTKMRKKKEREAQQQSQMNGGQQEEESEQIDGASSKGRSADPSGTYSRIQQNLDFLLDSDDDEDIGGAQEDGMIEKDLDNWI